MIQKLKMVNWKSHATTEMSFSPATNLLIGTMGSGKTSCLDAICFAFFGSFPSLKSRQVNLSDVLMARPDKKTNGLVEVAFTTGGKNYLVTRTLTGKGTEAFLRCDGALLEGPQPIRTTEAVQRVLKVDYDTFSRVIYGEQNKIDYMLTLPKGARKAQLDDLIGISLFEKVRTNSNLLVSKLASEKAGLEAFLTSVDVASIENELVTLKKTLQVAIEKKSSLESTAFTLSNELETLKKNLEALEELRKINEELGVQLVKTQTEADSLHSSAVSIMPAALSAFNHEQCTALLEQCARSLQERTDLEGQVAGLNFSIQRLEGEGLVLRQIVEQTPLDQLKAEIAVLSKAAGELETASQGLLDATKAESTLRANVSTLEAEFKQVAVQSSELGKKLLAIQPLEKQFGSIELLENEVKKKRSALLELEKINAAKCQSIGTMEKALSLLGVENAVCPTCDQPLVIDQVTKVVKQKNAALDAERKSQSEIFHSLNVASTEFASLDSGFSMWASLIPSSQKYGELRQRESAISAGLTPMRSELANAVSLVKATGEKVAVLKNKAAKLEASRQSLVHVENSLEKLAQLQRELLLLKEELGKKNLAVSTFDEKGKIEEKLNEARSALKAFELFEKTQALKTRAVELTEKIGHLQFNEAELYLLREKNSICSSNLQSTNVSLGYVNAEVREKADLISKLEAQFSKLSSVKRNCADLGSKLNQLSLFQRSLVETQAELRAELIGAVNEAMHEIWRNIYPYRDYASCRVVPTEDDYLIEVLAGGEWKPVEQCSGGEKTCAALALRVSLAMVLVPSLSWLVLDEPTHNLDSQGINLLARALHDSLPTIVAQTFVVTHDEALKEGASGSVHVFQRDKDSAAATVVETLS